MRTFLRLSLLALLATALLGRQTASPQEKVRPIPGKFTDVTSALGIHFNYLSSHTPKHYLPETMGAGVALFDYDNDGLLDIFVVNGAPILDPTPKGTAKGPQFATVSTAGSYLSSSDKRVHFGLGSESFAQSVEIRWPSGILQTLKNVRADQILQVDEPPPGLPPAGGAAPK